MGGLGGSGGGAGDSIHRIQSCSPPAKGSAWPSPRQLRHACCPEPSHMGHAQDEYLAAMCMGTDLGRYLSTRSPACTAPQAMQRRCVDETCEIPHGKTCARQERAATVQTYW